jgi:hypothetical protein
MTIQGQNQRAYWVSKLGPCFGTAFWWQTHPCGYRAIQFRLDVGLLGISLLDIMSGQESVGITRLASLKCGWSRTQFLKQSNIPIFITNLVSLEHNTPLEFSGGVIWGKFAVFLGANFKDASNVCLGAFTSRLIGDIGPFTHT